MKLNLILAATLTFLILGVYYFIELPERELQNRSYEIENIFSYNKEDVISSFKTANLDVVKNGDKFFITSENKFADEKKINTTLEFLQNIRARRMIEGEIDEAKFFTNKEIFFTFKFSNGNEITYTIGNKLDYADEFYLQISDKTVTKTVIAYNSMPGIILDGNTDMQYNKLLALLKLTNKELIISQNP